MIFEARRDLRVSAGGREPTQNGAEQNPISWLLKYFVDTHPYPGFKENQLSEMNLTTWFRFTPQFLLELQYSRNTII